MMNDEQVKTFLDAMGALTELWYTTYQNFVRLGLQPAEALIHTQAMISTLLNTNSRRGEEEDG